MGIAVFITFRQYVKAKSPYALYFALAWASYTAWAVTSAISSIMLSAEALLVTAYVTIPLAYFLVMFLDCIAREEIDPKKLIMVTALVAVKVVLALEPDAIWWHSNPEGASEPAMKASLLLAGSALMLVVGLLYVYYMARIHRNAPRAMRRNSIAALIGAIVMGIATPVLAVLRVPGVPLYTGAGVLLTSLAFARQPQMAYVLPFQAHRLMVIENEGGIALFSHTWQAGSKFKEPDLFSSMVQGIRCIMQESLQKGNVREIQLDEAVILIQQCPKADVSCLIVATRSAPSLRQALKAFATMFQERFGASLDRPNSLSPFELSAFEPAEVTVKDCFTFLPDYA